MYRFFTLVLIIWIAFGNTQCGPTTSYTIADSLYLINHADFFYDLKKPREKHFLPYVLSEISGLAYTDEGHLICVEDEGGRVYFYDPKVREIVHSIRFWGPGDFEGVELVGDQIYVLESNGDLFHFPMTDQKEMRATRINTALNRSNNAEGLGYDPDTHCLLIACKDDGSIDGNETQPRAIYSYQLDSGTLTQQARFVISREKLLSFFRQNRSYDYEPERIKFKPSGIAFHPVEKTFYVLASVGKLLVNVNFQGDIIATYPISPRVLNQPEGVIFSPDGDLFISSEGEGDRGYILKFQAVKRQ